MAAKPPTRQRSRSSATRSSAQHETEYIYHWNRIFIAVAVLVVVLGLIAFGLYAWLLSPSQPGTAMVNGEVSTSVDPVIVREEPDPEFDRAPSLSDEPDSEPAPPPAEVVLPEDAASSEELGNGEAIDLAQLGVMEILPDPASDGIAEPVTPEADVPPPQLEPSSAPSEELVRDPEDGIIRAPRVSIVSEVVQRFSLAPSVVDNEPRGELEEVRPDANGVARVAAFSEVRGFDGEILHYVWFHQGREVARVRVPVRAGRWRSHSTKWVGGDEAGEWRVELQDSVGAVLARISFVI